VRCLKIALPDKTERDAPLPLARHTSKLEQVFAGDDLHRAWPIDIELGSDGEPALMIPRE
jgi:hypothetical protein